MSEGSENARKLDEILTFLFERWATDVSRAVKLREIQEKLGVDEAQGFHLMKLLVEQGFIEPVVSKVYRLTGPGVAAARLAAESHDQGARPPSRPIGFREPSEEEGEM